MTVIQRLTDEGRDVVESYDVFNDESEVYELSDEVEDHVETIEVEDATIRWEELDNAIERAITVFDSSVETQRSAMDSMLAPLVRQYFDIPPRAAGRIGIWQYLTLIEYPEYVVTRWLGHGDLKEKLLGEQKDLYSNQMARLWWGGHLTYSPEEDHYFGAHKLFNKQRTANYVFDSEFRRHRPATLAFVDVVHSETGETITAVGSRFNQSLSTYQMESRTRDEFTEQVSTILDFVTSS